MITNIIIGLLVLAAIFSGYKRGLFKEGRYIAGVIVSFFAIPIFSPYIENIIFKIPVIQQICSVFIFRQITAYALRIFTFVVTATLIRKAFYMLTDIEMVGAFKIIDKIAGILFAISKVVVLIWVIDWLVISNKYLGNILIFKEIKSSALYHFICSYNMLKQFFVL